MTIITTSTIKHYINNLVNEENLNFGVGQQFAYKGHLLEKILESNIIFNDLFIRFENLIISGYSFKFLLFLTVIDFLVFLSVLIVLFLLSFNYKKMSNVPLFLFLHKITTRFIGLILIIAILQWTTIVFKVDLSKLNLDVHTNFDLIN